MYTFFCFKLFYNYCLFLIKENKWENFLKTTEINNEFKHSIPFFLIGMVIDSLVHVEGKRATKRKNFCALSKQAQEVY